MKTNRTINPTIVKSRPLFGHSEAIDTSFRDMEQSVPQHFDHDI
jgi:hypothetical protein